ncbi:Phage minor structural protein GP20 [Peptostreptococcus russellii]|uniref:Phage minor structural protein GP20 n=1 Tax=Peptostreptococcus russellii TaxID=215200 RepID=A0A1H8L065_9FIRM|nr:phage scaffolding protein [Peptostreptococcus russellii]SEN98038.1 Phage minor structural protein GP20 [Peptostreptococcus russellii]
MEWLNEILKDVEGKEEIIKSIKKGIGENFVSKADFNAKNEMVKTLEQTVKDRDGQLETLKNSKEDTETLKATIETLQKENQANEENYQADIKAMKLDSAIKIAIAGKVHDEELVSGLFNKDTLIVGDDGNIIGLDEQLKGLQKDKAFLFKAKDESSNDISSGVDFKFGAGKNEPKVTESALSDAFGLPSKE